MTSAQHRAALDARARRSDGFELKGGAPQGMWWVAWRQHRLQVGVALGLMAALAAAMIVFRVVLVAKMTAAGCSLTEIGPPCEQVLGAGDLWSNSFDTPSAFFHLAMTLLPVVVGVFVAAPVFPREFAQGTHVLALTQSVSRGRWWAVKLVIVSFPIVLGLLVLGVLMQWVDGSYWITASQPAMSTTNFGTRSIIPAAYGLVSVAVALTAGIAVRHVVGTLLVGLLIAGAVVTTLTVAVRPHLLPTSRVTSPVVTEADINASGAAAAYYSAEMEAGALYVRGGCLTADGGRVSCRITHCQMPEWDPDATDADNNRAQQIGTARCLHEAGIVSYYTDYLPGSMLWPLRWAMTGICVILAALFLGFGAWRLKPAVAKR